jgi:hypothetical protein
MLRPPTSSMPRVPVNRRCLPVARSLKQGWLLRRTGETLRALSETSPKPQHKRALPKEEPFNTRRSITSDGDQTAPGIRQARAAGPSPAAVHALPSRALWPGCARARRRARDRAACPWARRRTRSHRPLPHPLASSARPGGASAGVGNDRLVKRAGVAACTTSLLVGRSQAGHGSFAEPFPLAGLPGGVRFRSTAARRRRRARTGPGAELAGRWDSHLGCPQAFRSHGAIRTP